MTHTTNYNLNKFEATDRVTRDGFNDNADAIDAALKSVSDAASTAQSTAATALAAAQAAAAAGCRVVAGTYTGDGTYGVNNQNTLSFDGKPVLLFVIDGSSTQRMWAVRASTHSYSSNAPSSHDATITLTWGDHSVSWYASDSSYASANTQLNFTHTYHYAAILSGD